MSDTGGSNYFVQAESYHFPYPRTCHGCQGRGWCENSIHELKLCPVCKGSGKYNDFSYRPPWGYEFTPYWHIEPATDQITYTALDLDNPAPA